MYEEGTLWSYFYLFIFFPPQCEYDNFTAQHEAILHRTMFGHNLWDWWITVAWKTFNNRKKNLSAIKKKKKTSDVNLLTTVKSTFSLSFSFFLPFTTSFKMSPVFQIEFWLLLVFKWFHTKCFEIWKHIQTNKKTRITWTSWLHRCFYCCCPNTWYFRHQLLIPCRVQLASLTPTRAVTFNTHGK